MQICGVNWIMQICEGKSPTVKVYFSDNFCQSPSSGGTKGALTPRLILKVLFGTTFGSKTWPIIALESWDALLKVSLLNVES